VRPGSQIYRVGGPGGRFSGWRWRG